METIVTIMHLLVALAIIGLILMQQGKGAEAGASFGGGASQTVFGSQGGSNFFAKATAVFAFIFFATSFTLAVIAKDKTEIGTVDGVSALFEQVQDSEVPVAEGVVATESELPNIPTVSDAGSEVPAQ
ncbi:MAG: preprotein translocase subunit SecG [Candidatus Endobugula sp.]|jgi:preprotein translocase subunit SecG